MIKHANAILKSDNISIIIFCKQCITKLEKSHGDYWVFNVKYNNYNKIIEKNGTNIHMIIKVKLNNLLTMIIKYSITIYFFIELIKWKLKNLWI